MFHILAFTAQDNNFTNYVLNIYHQIVEPNTENVPFKINLFSSVDQLRCAGVVAAITISRVAYPNRLTFFD